MQAHVRILVEVDDVGNVIPDKSGHYDLIIDAENVHFDQYVSRTYDYPVFSYGPDATPAERGALTVFDSIDSERHYAGKKYQVWTDDFDVTEEDVYNFHERIHGTINVADTSKKVYLADKNAWAYMVTHEDFAEYDFVNANCFMAVATWASWLGYDVPMRILEEAPNNEYYFASKMLAEHQEHWTYHGEIGL